MLCHLSQAISFWEYEYWGRERERVKREEGKERKRYLGTRRSNERGARSQAEATRKRGQRR